MFASLLTPSSSTPTHAQTEDFTSSHTFMAAGVDNSFTLEDFKRGFSIQVVSLGALRFSLGGCAPRCCVTPADADPPPWLLVPRRAGDAEV